MIRTVFKLLLPLAILFVTSPACAQSGAIKLPLSKPVSSLKFGVESPSPTLQMSGSFSKFNGTLLLDPQEVTNSKVNLSLDLRSAQLLPDQIIQTIFLQTAIAHLKQPESTFISERIESLGGKRYLMHGVYTWQGKSKRTSVPVEIVSASPYRSEVRVHMSGQAKEGEPPKELQKLGGLSASGSKGWAKGTFIFTSNG